MSIYDQDYELIEEQLSPPDKRLPKWLAWLNSLMAPMQWVRDLFFESFVSGSPASLYSGATSYVLGDRVRFTDFSVYECILATTGNDPTDTTYWIKIQQVWMGSDERVMYTGQKLSLEYFLNRWFGTTFIQPVYNPPSSNSDIYLEENQEAFGFIQFTTEDFCSQQFTEEPNTLDFMYTTYAAYLNDFTVNIPLAVYNALGPDDPTRTAAVRQQVSKYSIFPAVYNIVTY